MRDERTESRVASLSDYIIGPACRQPWAREYPALLRRDGRRGLPRGSRMDEPTLSSNSRHSHVWLAMGDGRFALRGPCSQISVRVVSLMKKCVAAAAVTG